MYKKDCRIERNLTPEAILPNKKSFTELKWSSVFFHSDGVNLLNLKMCVAVGMDGTVIMTGYCKINSPLKWT